MITGQNKNKYEITHEARKSTTNHKDHAFGPNPNQGKTRFQLDSPWARDRNHAGEEEVDLEVGEADPIGDELKRRKRPPPLRSPGNSSCTPTYYQRGTKTRPPEDDAVATQHYSRRRYLTREEGGESPKRGRRTRQRRHQYL